MEKQKMIKDDTKEFQRKEEQKKVEYVGLSRIEPWAKGFQVERFCSVCWDCDKTLPLRIHELKIRVLVENVHSFPNLNKISPNTRDSYGWCPRFHSFCNK